MARPDLTDREQQILELVAAGLTDRQVGQQMGLSHRTVENHLQKVYCRLNARSRLEACRLAFGWDVPARAGLARESGASE